jgi:hypothetical protein
VDVFDASVVTKIEPDAVVDRFTQRKNVTVNLNPPRGN